MWRPSRGGVHAARPRAAVLVTLALLLAACAASAPPAGRPRPQAAPPREGAAEDASYDWHALVPAPFGTLLKDIPALHEVVLFHEEAHGSGDAEGADCHGIGAPPRFVGRRIDEYLLCFDHDRLTRIDASVRIPAEEAAQVFARACALWLKEPAPRPATADICEGRDGGIAFSARVSSVAGEPASLSLELSPAVGQALRDAPGATPREP